MPTRSRQSGARATTQTEEEGSAAYDIRGVDFKEPLSWRAGRAIPVADLFSRLQKLSSELRNADGQDVDLEALKPLAQDLVHPNLLGHKDKGIRACTVACVCDVLNVCAPNAPYRPGQLKDIFTVIAHTILPALADPSNAYNERHVYILNQLVDAESIVLVTDLQDADVLVSQIFSVAFDVVSGTGKADGASELSQMVVFQLTVMLNTIIAEATISDEIIEVIVSQFLRVDPMTNDRSATDKKKKKNDSKDKTQSTLILKDYPPAYNLAKAVCTHSSDKMAAAISGHFSKIITNASAALVDDEDSKFGSSKRFASPDDDKNDGQEALNDLRKAHRLIRELWRACPDVLNNVIPQLEVELSADSASLRQLAVETVGDMVAGIGLAGLPDLPPLDPTAFPLPTIENTDIAVISSNPLLQPSAPKPFIHIHASTYSAFLGRRLDKATNVRAAWAKATSRILLTRAGAIGLSKDELEMLISSYAKMLKDVEEKVRLKALEPLLTFPYHAIIEILASDGGLSESASLLSTVAERVVDKRLNVRETAMILLASMWGVASRDITNGVDRVRLVLGPAPTKLLSAMYVKDAHIGALMPKVLYEYLLPLSYPPIKGKVAISETQRDGDVSASSVDPDSLRVKRLLAFLRDLDDRAKAVFYGMQKRQVDMSKAINTFLKTCEEYNGGVVDDDATEKRLEQMLNRFIDSLSRQLPDSARAASDLWKFAKDHDRRNYQLIRFAIGPEHDYRTMTKAIKELKKRLGETGSTLVVLDTISTILYQCSLITYNRSHIPAIMEEARSSDPVYADVAQELLREISEKMPEVMKTHIQVLCRELEEGAPSSKASEAASAADSLKACSAFARKYPDEVSQDRKFYSAMLDFALYSASPRAAKHAATILLVASNKKEFYAKELLTKAIKRIKSKADNKATQLATIAQVCLLAPSAAEAEEHVLDEIVLAILQHNDEKATGWDPLSWDKNVDKETTEKQLALKIYVNRCRGTSANEDRESHNKYAATAIDVLSKIIKNDGELEPTNQTPSNQRNHLRLTSAHLLLKLCRHTQKGEDLVTSQLFQSLAWVLVSPPHGVRNGFVKQLKKYLSQGRLNARWLTLLFLLPFEPDDDLRLSTIAWLKSRAAFYARQQKQARANDKKAQQQTVMELVFARFLSLLVHHPDFPVKGETDYNGQLLDFAKYVIFYLQCVATEDNFSLVFHYAQRMKQVSDAVSKNEDADERLYVLSDLAQATMRNYVDQMPGSAKGMNVLQAFPGKAPLPHHLFKAINGHARAQEIAAKNYLPEDVALGLENLVRKMIRIGKQGASKPKMPQSEKKRKSSVSVDLDDEDPDSARKSTKKSKKSMSLPIRRTPNAKKRKSEHSMSVEQPSRKSARTSTSHKVNYEESDDNDNEVDGDGDEDIAKYKTTTTQSSRGKSGITEVIQEADEEEAEHPPTSPTPHSGDKAEDDEDVDMTNGHEPDEPTNGIHDEVEEDEQQEEDAEEEADEAEEEEGAPTSSSTRKSRSTKSKPATTPKATKPAKSVPAKQSATKTKPSKSPPSKSKKEETTLTSPAASATADSGRRRSARTKA